LDKNLFLNTKVSHAQHAVLRQFSEETKRILVLFLFFQQQKKPLFSKKKAH
tara:strand:+ start:915 stop:1067 length:153 start_codon:yes stop_codon:yes gene_type:complete